MIRILVLAISVLIGISSAQLSSAVEYGELTESARRGLKGVQGEIRLWELAKERIRKNRRRMSRAE